MHGVWQKKQLRILLAVEPSGAKGFVDFPNGKKEKKSRKKNWFFYNGNMAESSVFVPF